MVNAALIDLYQNTDLVLLDFDGCVTVYTNEHLAHCDWTGAKAVSDFLQQKIGVQPPFTKKEAAQLAKASYRDHGWAFIEFCCLYGLNPKTMHEIYHDKLNPDTVESIQVTKEQLGNFPKNFAILTHAHRCWIDKVSERFDLKDVIPEDRIFPLEEMGYCLKNNGGHVYHLVAQKTGIKLDRLLLIDDSLGNLEAANRAGQSANRVGVKTVHISKSEDPLPPYVNYRAPNLSCFCDDFSRAAMFHNRLEQGRLPIPSL